MKSKESWKSQSSTGSQSKIYLLWKRVIDDHTDIFPTSFSFDLPADIPLLKIDLEPNYKQLRVRLRDYYREHRDFLADKVEKLFNYGMAYSNTRYSWTSASSLLPKPGPSKYRFFVDLRPFNLLAVKHQSSILSIEEELQKLSGSSI